MSSVLEFSALHYKIVRNQVECASYTCIQEILYIGKVYSRAK